MKNIATLLAFLMLSTYNNSIAVTEAEHLARLSRRINIPEQDDHKKLYHKPQTEPEKVLDKILSQVIDDNNPKQREITDYVMYFQGKEREQKYDPKKYEYYSSLITDELAKAISDAEKRIAEKACPNPEDDKEGPCGMNFNPIICAQDYPEFYTYRTIKHTENMAVILTAWEYKGNTGKEYTLIKQSDLWKLNSIKDEYISFN